MAKKDKRVDLEGGRALTHNPFAALRRPETGPAEPARSDSRDLESAARVEEATPGADRVGGDVVVRHERKGRGGKTVTIAAWRGAGGPDAAALDRLARALGRRLGSRARVEAGAIVVQGELVERLATLLESEHGARVTRGTV